MNLHLLVPSLFWPETSAASPPEIYRDLPLPTLATLLAKSVRTTDSESQGMEAWLCRAFNTEKQQDWPVAPIALAADGAGNVIAGNDYWLRADPIHLRIERGQIVLADSQVFRISPEEAQEFASLLTRHFAESAGESLKKLVIPAQAGIHDLKSGSKSSADWIPAFAGMTPSALLRRFPSPSNSLVFLPLHPDRWYLRMAQAPVLQTHPLSQVAGKNINNFLPSGADSMAWHGIFNEIQMLLHEHPLNQAREARGELAINSVWFWGGGIMPQAVNNVYTKVWSNDVFARALALASHTDFSELPPTLSAAVWQPAESGNHLVVLDSLSGKAQYGDAYGWRESLKELEQNWFVPLLAGLKQGQLDQLTITAIGEHDTRNFTVTRRDLWKFWLARKPLSAYATES